MTDDEMCVFLKEQGYQLVRKLNDGRWIGIAPQIYTVGLCVNLDVFGYQGRYCYENLFDLAQDWYRWDGKGDPQGRWIKYKGPDGERMNQNGPR